MGNLFSYSPFLRGALAGMFYNYGFFTVLAYSPLVMNLPTIQLGLIFFRLGTLPCLWFSCFITQAGKKYNDF
jgi:ACDE family multidrug resistance protein